MAERMVLLRVDETVVEKDKRMVAVRAGERDSNLVVPRAFAKAGWMAVLLGCQSVEVKALYSVDVTVDRWVGKRGCPLADRKAKRWVARTAVEKVVMWVDWLVESMAEAMVAW